MEKNNSRVDEALACFKEGFACSQAVLSAFCEELGLDKETALKISCGLGAGMGRLQETCGAVTGAYLVIGLKYGSYQKGDREAKEKTYALVREFSRRFKEKNKTEICREILGVDLIKDTGRPAAKRVGSICPKMVSDAVEILESLLI